MTLAPFRRFSMEDQQEILTKVLVEMMILHTTAKYDCTTRSIPTYDGSQINKSRFIEFGAPEDIANDAFDLFHSVGKLKLSNETTGILCCLVIFSPDRNFSKSLDKGKLTRITLFDLQTDKSRSFLSMTHQFFRINKCPVRICFPAEPSRSTKTLFSS